MTPWMIQRLYRKQAFMIRFMAILFILSTVLPSAMAASLPEAQTQENTKSVNIANQPFHLEVANTPETRTQGLMHRDHLDPGTGMLFVFQPAQPVGFWMKNCLMPLDMLFIKGNTIRDIVRQAPPCQTESCPVYSSSGPVDWVIELPPGTAEHLHLKTGQSVAGLESNQ